MAKCRKPPKSASPDHWAFLEEIDAPQWVDLTSEGASNVDQRDECWFQTLHPFHLQSFHELVSPSPLGVRKKGKVSNSVHLYPGLLNSVSKSRGGKPFPNNKVSEFRLTFLEGNNPENRRTRRLSGRKPAIFKSKGNVKIGPNACLRKPSNDATTKSCLQIPSKGNELGNPIDARTSFTSKGNFKTGANACIQKLSNEAPAKSCVEILSKGNELDNPIDAPVFLKFKGNVKTGPNACLRKPTSEVTSKACSQKPSMGNEFFNPINAQFHPSAVQDCKNRSTSACLQISAEGNKLENPIHVQVRSSTVCDPCKENQLTNLTDIQGKSSMGDPENQSSTACIEIPSKNNAFGESIDLQIKSSAAADIDNQTNKACLQIPSKGNESKNLLDLPAVADINNLSMSTEFRSVMPISAGLITMLKAASLRRSCGVLPMRVEVKNVQEPTDRKSSSNKSSSGPSHDTKRKTSSLGSTGNNSQQVKKEDTLKQLKKQSQIGAMPSNKHNINKSNIGSFTTLEGEVKNGCRSSIQHSRKKADSRSSSNDTAMRYNEFGQALKKPGRKQGQPPGKDSGKLGRKQEQPIRGRTFGTELSMRGKTQASRQPLKDINKVGLSQHKSDILQNQRFSGKENNQPGTIHQKINRTERNKPLTNIKETFSDQVELKVHAQSKDETTLHSIKDIKQWEKNSGRSYFSLSRMEKEKANRQIQSCKSLSQ